MYVSFALKTDYVYVNYSEVNVLNINSLFCIDVESPKFHNISALGTMLQMRSQEVTQKRKKQF